MLENQKAARGLGMRTVWMQRYLEGRLSRPSARRREPWVPTLPSVVARSWCSPLPQPALRVCQNPIAATVAYARDEPTTSSLRSRPPEGELNALRAADAGLEMNSHNAEVSEPIDDAASAEVPAAVVPIRKRPKPGERRRADPADPREHARAARRRPHHHRCARCEARRVGGRAVPPFRQQGADVRRPDRVRRAKCVHADQPDPGARSEASNVQAQKMLSVLLQFAEKNPGMARVMVGDALVFENERLLARMNQFFERFESQLRQSLRGAADAAGSVTPTVDANAQASVLTAFAVGRLAALRAFRLQAQPDRAPRGGAADAGLLSGPAMGAGRDGHVAARRQHADAVAREGDLPAGSRHPARRGRPHRQGDQFSPARRAGAGGHDRRDAVGADAADPAARRESASSSSATSCIRRDRSAPDTLAAVLRWRELHSAVELTLVRGNHDDRAGDRTGHARHPALRRTGDVAWPRAEPSPAADERCAYVLAGHLHPCVSIGGRAHDWHRLAVLLVLGPGRRAAGVRRVHRHAGDPHAPGRTRVRGRARSRVRAAGQGRALLNIAPLHCRRP